MKYYDYLTELIFAEDPPRRSDYIFIPGSGCGELAQKAAKLYQMGYAEKIVVSGRYSILSDRFLGPESPPAYVGKTYETESDFLREVLLDENVPEQAIRKESQASYTYENAIYTRRLLGTERVERAILVCKTYHARRCLMYYSILFPDTELLVCPVAAGNITRENWHLDPAKIDIVLGEVQRLGSQFGDILKESIKERIL